MERDPHARIRLTEVVYFGISSGGFEAEDVPVIGRRQSKKRLTDHGFQLQGEVSKDIGRIRPANGLHL